MQRYFRHEDSRFTASRTLHVRATRTSALSEPGFRVAELARVQAKWLIARSLATPATTTTLILSLDKAPERLARLGEDENPKKANSRIAHQTSGVFETLESRRLPKSFHSGSQAPPGTPPPRGSAS